MSHSAFKVLPLILALGLAACGGGSDDSTSTTVKTSGATGTITTDNQTVVATEVADNAFAFSTSTLSQTNVAVSVGTTEAAPNMGQFINQVVQDGITIVVQNPATATLTPVTTCAGGGTATLTYDDKNANEQWDETESGSFVFANCVLTTGAVVNGKLDETYTRIAANGEVGKQYSLVFTNLKMTKGTVSSELVSGSMGFTDKTSATTASKLYKTTELKVKVSGSKVTENFSLNEDIAITNALSNTTVKTITGNGSIKTDNANINGSVTFKISDSEPVVIDTVAKKANSGLMTISDSNGLVLYVSFAVPEAGSVTLQLKKDDANVGKSVVIPVSTLMASFIEASAI